MTAVGTLPKDSLAEGLWPRTIQELLAFIGLADKQEIDLSAKINDLFKQITQVTDDLVLATIEKRTQAEFAARTLASFNDYVRILRAKSDLLQMVLRNDTHATERIVNQSLSELEGEFRDHGTQRFGAAVSEQAVFTLWTLRKTANQLWKLFSPGVLAQELQGPEKINVGKLSAEFALYSAWAQFHLECLTASMRLNKPVYPAVLSTIIDG